jgi:hypothetical protein
VGGLQRLQLAAADTRHDVKSDIAFICRVRCAADTRFRDVVKPIRQVFGHRQSRCRNRYPAPLLIPDFPQFVQSTTLAIAVNADPLSPPVRRVNEDLCLPTTIGSPIDATLPIRVTFRLPARSHHAAPSIKPAR